MRLLVFLLIGTLIFGFAFPAVILIAGVAGIILFALIIAGLLRRGGVRVYTSRSYDPFSGRTSERRGPEVIDTTDDDEQDNSAFNDNLDGEDEGEIVELPATALRKEDH